MKLTRNSIFLFFYLAVFLPAGFGAPQIASADYLGQNSYFNIDKNFDSSARSKTSATLQAMTDKLYFYSDDDWWKTLNPQEQMDYRAEFIKLGQEFTNTIYPKLTGMFGTDAKAGFDNDSHITILIHPMIRDAGGYINTADNYSKLQASTSNERKIIYLAARFATTSLAKVYLAHEFMHLIDFNQKDKMRQISEETWLNEARADYTSTFLGYDDKYIGSNLEQRVNKFTAQPNESITEWDDSEAAYGAAHLFTAYLVDHYGIKILADSLQSGQIGIPSLNVALKNNSFVQNFVSIFKDWLIALLTNDCSLGQNYCYLNPNLKALKILPRINYLPPSSEVSLSVNYHSTYYAGNWQKIVGGKGNLQLKFQGPKTAKTLVPYFVCDPQNQCQIKEILLDENQQGSLSLQDYGKSVESIVLMPFISGKVIGFDSKSDELTYNFTVDLCPAATTAQNLSTGTNTMTSGTGVDPKVLLQTIARIQQEIIRLKILLSTALAVEASAQPKYSCNSINADLYYGVEQAAPVRCLQEVLRAQGLAVYPEAKITGNFSSATQEAVIRFQEKYANEILLPLGLNKGTGYVGAATRQKLNHLLTK